MANFHFIANTPYNEPARPFSFNNFNFDSDPILPDIDAIRKETSFNFNVIRKTTIHDFDVGDTIIPHLEALYQAESTEAVPSGNKRVKRENHTTPVGTTPSEPFCGYEIGVNTNFTSAPFQEYGDNPVMSSSGEGFRIMQNQSLDFGSPFPGFSTTQSSSMFNLFGAGDFSIYSTSPAPSIPPTLSPAPLLNGFGNTVLCDQYGMSYGVPAIASGTPIPEPLSEDEYIARSVWSFSMFGDSRDVVYAKWNYLQAQFGCGTIHDYRNIVPVEITSNNFLCRFKTVNYIKKSGFRNKMGLVLLTFDAIVDHQADILNRLFGLFDTKQNLILNVVTTVPTKGDRIQIVIFVEKVLQTPYEKKIMLSRELTKYLSGSTMKKSLASIGLIQVDAMIPRSRIELKEYLEKPPNGILPEMWEAAQQTNRDASRFIPVPIIGALEPAWQRECLNTSICVNNYFTSKLANEIDQLKQRHIITMAKLEKYRMKFDDLRRELGLP